MRVARQALEWGPDDPARVMDLNPEMLYSRVSGISREEMESRRFARAALKMLASVEGRGSLLVVPVRTGSRSFSDTPLV